MCCKCMGVCVYVCGRVSALHPSDRQTETAHFPNSNSQKTSHEKRAAFEKVTVALIPYLFRGLNCTGYINMQIPSNPALSKPEQTFHSSLKQQNKAEQGDVIHIQLTPPNL